MYKVYQILEGETVNDVAQKFGTTVEEIKKLNGYIENGFFKPGVFIIVPNKEEAEYSTYTVKQGDNIYGIAKANQIDPDILLKINGLDHGDYIYPNQKLLIPRDNKVYVTKTDDTLQSVVSELGYTIPEFISKYDKIYLLPDQLFKYK